MSRRDPFDIAVVGAGMVGTCAALAAAQQGRRVALIEAHAPPPWQADPADLRVVAFAPDNARLLQRLGVWESVRSARAQAYRRMEVWDAGGGAALHFDAREHAVEQLGWIIENSLLVDRLWQAASQQSGVQLFCPGRLQGLRQEADRIVLDLDQGSSVHARLLLAADGAASPCREHLGITTQRHDYKQVGLVAYIDCELDHAETCYQRFLPTGPLAFLPFGEGRCSIVWTVPGTDRARLLELPEARFEAELERAFDGRLGRLKLASPRRAFPLQRQLAAHYAGERALLIGDAAHVVHPLAGQGVNLGLRDVSAFAAWLRECDERDLGEPRRLQRLARERRSENAVAAYSFEAIERVYTSPALLPTLLRGPLLGLADRLAPIKHGLLRRAVGGDWGL